ncbi:MAG TPA: hypothetical protein DEB17_02795 [Chlorobaculum sp.]|uniref:Uncharacterized protein n=1 Tax=Chlorobaculum tepidum (strain ATCC 49652 / DSM 12025 / NBRC 103806 / TLS) TaxID=194439 RepID=Q8KEC8_CHLTE|nr:hypothetical protein CT0761 [Chlorobaculum tepidum TLS]HBU22918.1 hypothetical protein [Chlorobaculum sp.]
MRFQPKPGSLPKQICLVSDGDFETVNLRINACKS